MEAIISTSPMNAHVTAWVIHAITTGPKAVLLKAARHLGWKGDQARITVSALREAAQDLLEEFTKGAEYAESPAEEVPTVELLNSPDEEEVPTVEEDPITEWFNYYDAIGFKLCAIPPGSKGPRTPGWNQPGNELTAPPPPGYGFGLLHAYSKTMVLDIDNLPAARELLAAHGIDLDGLLSAPGAVQISSGRPERAKLIFRQDPPLPSKTVKAEDGSVAYELRCATADGLSVQDCLPPTIHPTTGKPYVWAGTVEPDTLPPLPESLLAHWQSLLMPVSESVPLLFGESESITPSVTAAEIRHALSFISPDCSYDDWITAAMAIHASGIPQEEGFNTWLEWSRGGTKFEGEGDLATHWRSFTIDKKDGVTIGTLFHLATPGGWTPPPPDVTGIFAPVVEEHVTIESALTAQHDDPGAVFHPKALALFRQVRATDTAEWARIREKVKQCRNVPMSDFDKATELGSAAESGDSLPQNEPWPVEVPGGELLDDMVSTIKRFVVADDESIQIAALWTLATYFAEVAKFAPILNVTAPAKRCGKTLLMEVIKKTGSRTMMTSNIGAAALFRSIELWKPTLLIDEVDTFLQENEDARGIINAGVQPGGCVIRCVGDDFTPTPFNVFGFKALAGIGALADTLNDRSIPVRLRRKFPTEKTENIRHAADEDFQVLRQKGARFAKDNLAAFAAIRPDPIQGLHDRANDCLEPLLQVAHLAGFDWMMKATAAAISLMKDDGNAHGGTDMEMLAAIRRAFAVNGVDRISLAALAETLVHEEDSRWADYNHGKPIKPGQISKRMRDFAGITMATRHHPKTIYKAIGNPAKEVTKGYHLEKFQDAFDRYLPPVTDEEKAAWTEIENGYFEGGFPKLPI